MISELIKLNNVKEILGCMGITTTGIPYIGIPWSYIFIQNSQGVSVGRLTFKVNDLYYYKSYKLGRYSSFSLDETDYIFAKIEIYLETGVVFPDTYLWKVEERAAEERLADLKAKRAWREANPLIGTTLDKHGLPVLKRRKKLQGKHLLGFFYKILRHDFEEHRLAQLKINSYYGLG